MEPIEQQWTSCPECATQMPEKAAFCPGCGRAMQAEERAQGKVGILAENIAGGLAYITFIPAVIFLMLEPYRRNRFVRFHALQCLMLWGTIILLAIVLRLLGLLLFIIPVLGPLLVLLIDTVVALAAAFTWLILLLKALQGHLFHLPLLGDFAERRARGI